jgi:hypothetical protein
MLIVPSVCAINAEMFGVRGSVITEGTKHEVTSPAIIKDSILVANKNNFSIYVEAKVQQQDALLVFTTNHTTIPPFEKANLTYRIEVLEPMNRTFKPVIFFSKTENSSGIGIPSIILVQTHFKEGFWAPFKKIVILGSFVVVFFSGLLLAVRLLPEVAFERKKK